MTVHTQRIDVRRRPVAAVGQNGLLWLAIVAAVVLLALAVLFLVDVITPVTGPTVPLIERLHELRTTLGQGGFI